MEGVRRGLDPEAVVAAIGGVDGVVDVHHLHPWNLASDVPAASAEGVEDPGPDGVSSGGLIGSLATWT
jgi:cobalt-zinc-cadmium efflux system protein